MTELRIQATELLLRLRKEGSRGPVATTLQVGGLAIAGAQLERVLRAAVEDAARDGGLDPQDLLVRAGRSVPFQHAGSGELAAALRAHSRQYVHDPALRLVMDDLKAARSAIGHVIKVRNHVAHHGVAPPDAERALGQLAVLFERVVAVR